MRIDGIVLTEDDKLISNLIMLTISPDKGSLNLNRLSDRFRNDQFGYLFEMMFVLGKRELDYVEEIRQKNKKHDVVFKLRLLPTYLTPMLQLGEYGKAKSNLVPNQEIPTLAPGRPDSMDANLRIVVSEQSSLFEFESIPRTLSYTVRSSDWVNDFQGPLGMGKFLIVEIPQLATEGVPTTGLDSEEVEFKTRLDKATEILKEMELELNKGEWGDLVSESRTLIELFRKPPEIKDRIKRMIADTTSIEPEKAASLTESIDKLFGYASDLHHTVNDAGKMKTEVYTGGKEDAYMVYMLSASVVNLLERKFKAHVSRQTVV